MTLHETVHEGGPETGHEEHPDGIRERKKLATRRSLRRHALDLFARRGFAKVTVEDIAAAADVSPRTFFNYFPSKEAALLDATPEKLESVRLAILSAASGATALGAVQVALAKEACELVEDVEALGHEPGQIVQIMKAASADPEFRAARAAQMANLERAVASAVAERFGVDVEKDPYPLLLAGTAVAAMRVAIFAWASLGGKVPIATLTNAALCALGEGLGEDNSFRRVVLGDRSALKGAK